MVILVSPDKFSSRGLNLPVNLMKISDFHSQLIHLNQCWGYNDLWLFYQVCSLCVETGIYSTFFFLGYLMFKSQLHELFRLKFRLNPRTSNTDLELQSWIPFTWNLHAYMLSRRDVLFYGRCSPSNLFILFNNMTV